MGIVLDSPALSQLDRHQRYVGCRAGSGSAVVIGIAGHHAPLPFARPPLCHFWIGHWFVDGLLFRRRYLRRCRSGHFAFLFTAHIRDSLFPPLDLSPERRLFAVLTLQSRKVNFMALKTQEVINLGCKALAFQKVSGCMAVALRPRLI